MVIVGLATDAALLQRNPDKTARCVIRSGMPDQIELDVPAYELAGVPNRRALFEVQFTAAQQTDFLAWLAARPTIQSRVSTFASVAAISPAWREAVRP